MHAVPLYQALWHSKCVVTNAQQKALHSMAFHCQRRRVCAFTNIASTFSSEEASVDLLPSNLLKLCLCKI